MERSSLSILLVLGFMMGIMPTCWSYDFFVGGRDGWVANPSESLNQWAQKNRFRLNDRLVFKYKNRDDSVLVVTKEDYEACAVASPIKKFDGGDSVFRLDHSGPHYFISGNPGRCQQGEKLIVVVLGQRVVQPPSSSSPSLQPPSLSPAVPPSSGSSGVAVAPSSMSPAESVSSKTGLAPVPSPSSATDDGAVSAAASVLSATCVSLVMTVVALGVPIGV